MPRPALEPHLRRLLIEESTYIVSLFQVDGKGRFFCAALAPAENVAEALFDGRCYAHGQGDTPEDAVYAMRTTMWSGL